MTDLPQSLAVVMELLGRATPGVWSATYTGRGNMRFRHISATAPAIPGFCGERPIELASLAVISEQTDSANAALIAAAVNFLRAYGPEIEAAVRFYKAASENLPPWQWNMVHGHAERARKAAMQEGE